MTDTTRNENSETELMNSFYKFVDSGASVIQIRTRETVRTALALRRSILADDSLYSHHEWDSVNGFRQFTLENYTNNLPQGDDVQFFEAIMRPMEELRNGASAVNAEADKVHFFVYLDPDAFMKDNPVAVELMQQYAAMLPSKNVCVVLITPHIELSYLPLGTVLITDMPTPCQEELENSLEVLLSNAMDDSWEGEHTLTEQDISSIALLGLGMTRYEYETHVSLAIVQASIDGDARITVDAIRKGVIDGKTDVVKQSDILELFPSESMANVGGMARLKDWINARSSSFTEEARDFGIKPPKGMALVGIPGSGKSLVAKAVAGSLGWPLIRLDFGRVFSKFIGDSESRLRQSLQMIERMDKLVLFADEIDKGLGGAGGGSDGGVSSRVLGTFLTWMQENKSNAFVIMTANRIEGLPPELFRRGRLDAVFSVGLPSRTERREVLEVHMRKKKRSIKEFSAGELVAYDKASDGYVPAEIECAVNDALVMAFNDDDCDDVEMRHLLQALADMVPMSTSHAEQVLAITTWAAKNATPVNYEEKPAALANAGTTDTASRRRPRTAAVRPTKH